MNWDLFILWLFSKQWGDDWIDLEFFDLRISLALSLLWTADPYNQLPLQDFYLRVQQGPWASHPLYEVMMSTTTPNNQPAVSPFQLKATLFFQLLRPNLRVNLDISYSSVLHSQSISKSCWMLPSKYFCFPCLLWQNEWESLTRTGSPPSPPRS